MASLLIDWALPVSLKMSTSQRIPNTVYKIKVNNCKLINLVIRRELTRAILMPRFLNLLRNQTIHFRVFLHSETCFLRVAVSLLCRSQCRTISSPFTNYVDTGIHWHVSVIQLVTGIATELWLSGNMLPNIKACEMDERISQKIWEWWH